VTWDTVIPSGVGPTAPAGVAEHGRSGVPVSRIGFGTLPRLPVPAALWVGLDAAGTAL
jgi:hypothetical protein